MPNSELTVELIEEEIRGELGDTLVDVEINRQDVTRIIRGAIRLYNRTVPVRRKAALTIARAQKKYPITHAGLRGITEVEFLGPRAEYEGLFDPMTWDSPSGIPMSADTYGNIMARFQYLEQARRLVSAEPEWSAQWEADGLYYLYISVTNLEPVILSELGATQYLCSYTYTISVTADDDTDTGLLWVPASNTDWIVDYCIAAAKTTLGRALRKQGGVPMPDGGTEQTDGEALVTEGREDLERLRTELNGRRRPLIPVIG